MNRLKAANSVIFASRDTAPNTGTPQYATSGNPATSTPATIWPAYMFNMMLDEMMSVVTAAGLTPDDTNWNQLWQGLFRSVSFTDAGTLNHLVVPLPSGLTFPNAAIGLGTTIRVKMINTNTSAVDLAAFGNPALAVTLLSGQALTGGEFVAGNVYEMVEDGAGHWQVTSAISKPQLANFLIISAGSGNVTIPADYFEVEGWGAGGGSMDSAAGVPVCGGGAGGYFFKRYFQRGTYAYVVGSGGSRTNYGTTGNPGGTTTFNAGAQQATGGGGSDQAALGTGGIGTGGELNLTGAEGYAAASAANLGGSGGTSPRGNGGGGASTGVAQPGTIPGTGAGGPGGGATGFPGQAGGDGRIFIRY